MPGYALGGLRLDADLWSLTLDGRVTELGASGSHQTM